MLMDRRKPVLFRAALGLLFAPVVFANSATLQPEPPIPANVLPACPALNPGKWQGHYGVNTWVSYTGTIPASENIGTTAMLQSAAGPIRVECTDSTAACPSGWFEPGSAQSPYGQCYNVEGASLMNIAVPAFNIWLACGSGGNLSTLSAGPHTVSLHCADGKTETATFNVTTKPGSSPVYDLDSDTFK